MAFNSWQLDVLNLEDHPNTDMLLHDIFKGLCHNICCCGVVHK